MNKIPVYMFTLFLLLCCRKPSEHYLPENERYYYLEGDKLLYKSNLNNFDILFVDTVSIKMDVTSSMTNSPLSEFQYVAFHFLSDLYNPEMSNMNIKFRNDALKYKFSFLIWKKHPLFFLYNHAGDTNLIVNDIEYNDVFILHRDEKFIDSTIIFEKIYFNYKYGILRFENKNSEVFEFVGKL